MLSTDHLSETLVEMFLEKNLRLGLVDEDLANKLSFIHDLVLAAASFCLTAGLLGLSSCPLAVLTTLGEDVVL